MTHGLCRNIIIQLWIVTSHVRLESVTLPSNPFLPIFSLLSPFCQQASQHHSIMSLLPPPFSSFPSQSFLNPLFFSFLLPTISPSFHHNIILLFSFFNPKGMHIVQLFIQFAPYTINPSEGSWTDPLYKESFADRVFSIVDEYAPGVYVHVQFAFIFHCVVLTLSF